MRRALIVVVVPLLALAVLLALAAPYLLPSVLEHVAARRGLPLQVGAARVDWRDSRVSLTDVRLGDPRAPALAWASVDVEVNPAALAGGRIDVRGLRLRGLHFDLDALASTGTGSGLVDSLARIGDIQIEATELPWLTSALGSRARIERVRCGGLARLASGEDASCELVGMVGEAPLRVSTTLGLDTDALRYHAVIRTDGLELERWQNLLDGGPYVIKRAVAHAAASLSGRYTPAEGLVDVSGDLTVTFQELVAGSDGLAISGRGVVWHGSVDAGWAAAGGLVAARARGRLEVQALELAAADAGSAQGLTLGARDVEFRGGIDLAGSSPTLEGSLQAGELSLAGAGGWRASAVDLSARGGVRREGAALEVALDSTRARELTVDLPVQSALGTIVVDDLQAEALGGAVGGSWRAARIRAVRTTSTASVRSPRGEGPRLRMPGLTAVGVEFGPGWRVEARYVDAPGLDLRGEGFEVVGRQLRADAFSARVPEGLSAREFTAGRLDTAFESSRTRYRDLRSAGLTVRVDGSVSVREQQIAAVEVELGGGLRWEAESVAAASVRRSVSGATAADELRAARVRYAGASPGEMQGFHATSFAAAPDGRLGAARIEIAAAEIDERDAGRWRASGVKIVAPGFDPGRQLEMRRIEIASLTLDEAGQYTWALGTLVADQVGGRSLFDLGATSLSVGSLDVDLGAGHEFSMSGFRARTFKLIEAAGFEAAEATLERLDTRRGSRQATVGERLRARDLHWELATRVSARALDVGRLSGNESSGLRWVADRVASRRLTWSVQVDRVVTDRLEAGTIRFETDAPWRFETAGPQVEGFDWTVGTLPGFSAGSAGVTGGSAGPVGWQIETVELSGGAAEARRYEAMLLRGIEIVDQDTGVSMRVHAARFSDLGFPSWPALDAGALEADDVRIGGAPDGDLGIVRIAWLRGSEARIEIGESVDLEDLVLSGLLVGLGVSPDGQRVAPVLDPRRIGGRPNRVRFGHLATEGNARLTYVDRSVQPNVALALDPLTVEIEGFDTSRPGEPGRFEFRARTTTSGTVSVRGLITPSFSTLDVEATVVARGLALANLSPWAEQHHGVRIVGGRMDIDLDAQVEDRHIDGTARVLITGLDVAPPPRAGRSGSYGETGSRVGGSLRLLEDTDGRIVLEVPFSGALDDPEFRFSGVFAKALANTATNAVLLALKPIGLIAKGLFSGLTQASFPPIQFAPGEVSLSAEDLIFLGDLADQLAERPRMRLALCGKSGPRDRAALQRAFSHPGKIPAMRGGAGVTPIYTTSSLARARAAEARDWLLSRDGPRPEQIAGCEPEVETDADAVPRIEVILAHSG